MTRKMALNLAIGLNLEYIQITSDVHQGMKNEGLAKSTSPLYRSISQVRFLEAQ
jgi:hypothetical protein